MEHRSFIHLYRYPSTGSTASAWSASTRAGMGLAIEHGCSNDAEGSAESLPLRTLHALDCSSQSEQVDHVQDDPTLGAKNGSEIAGPNSQPPSRDSIVVIKIWWLELTSCLLVVTMIAALVGTIQPHQGQPLPRWPYSLSINTVVSFYSEAMRAAMILVLGECLSQLKWSWFTRPRPLDHIEHYDNASRGPWGSAKLLWALRLRAVLPSIGGIMMILLLLLVPLTQQIIQFYSCDVPYPALDASTPKTNFASAGTSMHVGAGLNAILSSVQDAMNRAVYESEPEQVPFSCPTGNCTFDGVYHSAGWCSRCEDISNEIEFFSNNSELNFTLPSSKLTATAGIRTFVMGLANTSIQTILGFSENGTQEGPSGTPWRNRGYGAAQCAIDPCVSSYTSTVRGGILTETLLSTSKIGDTGEYWLNSIDVSCLKNDEIRALHDAGYEFDPLKTAWLSYNLSAEASDAFNPSVLNPTNTTIRPECIYQTFRGEMYSLNVYLGSMFTGEVAYAVEVLDGPTILQSMFQEGNVTYSTINSTFDRVAQALTIYTREEGSNITGQVYRTETCIGVRWGWLAYPLSLMLGTVILLGWTIGNSMRNEGSRQDYKSSPLPLLFHRLGDVGSEGPVSSIANSDELRKKSEKMEVTFQSVNGVWRFIETKRSKSPLIIPDDSIPQARQHFPESH